jgi:hypothetical protein
MQETQKPNKEIERLEDESSTLGLLVTTVVEKGIISQEFSTTYPQDIQAWCGEKC